MKTNTIVGIVSIISLSIVLVLGVAVFGADTATAGYVATILGIAGLTVNQMLGHKANEDTKETVETLSADLRNGTFRKLLKEALEDLAKDNTTPLEIQQAPTTQEGNDNG